MGKYDGIKNPALTDEEYEKWEEKNRIEAIMHIITRDESVPGTFLGYWCCPTCHEKDIHERIEMIRPASGVLEIPCKTCGQTWTITLPRTLKAYSINEGGRP